MNYPRGQALERRYALSRQNHKYPASCPEDIWAASSRGNYLQLAQLLQIGEDQLPGMLAFEGNWTEVDGWLRKENKMGSSNKAWILPETSQTSHK